MKHILIALLVLLSLNSSAQTQPTVAVNLPTFNNTTFLYTDISASKDKLKCKGGMITAAYIISFSGGLVVGWCMADILLGNDVNEIALVGGLCAMVSGIILENAGRKKCKKMSTARNSKISLASSGNTVGAAFNF